MEVLECNGRVYRLSGWPLRAAIAAALTAVGLGIVWAVWFSWVLLHALASWIGLPRAQVLAALVLLLAEVTIAGKSYALLHPRARTALAVLLVGSLVARVLYLHNMPLLQFVLLVVPLALLSALWAWNLWQTS